MLYGSETVRRATSAAIKAASAVERSVILGTSSARNVSGTAKSKDQLGGMSAPKKIPQSVANIQVKYNDVHAPAKKGALWNGLSGLLNSTMETAYA